MDKPEWCSAEVWQKAIDAALQVSGWGDIYTSSIVEDIASAILSAQSQAYIDAARIASEAHDWAKGEYEKDPNDGPFTLRSAMATSKAISAAILQRKEEIGR